MSVLLINDRTDSALKYIDTINSQETVNMLKLQIGCLFYEPTDYIGKPYCTREALYRCIERASMVIYTISELSTSDISEDISKRLIQHHTDISYEVNRMKRHLSKVSGEYYRTRPK